MGIIAWIVLGLAAGLLANMLIPGKRSQGLSPPALAHRCRSAGAGAQRRQWSPSAHGRRGGSFASYQGIMAGGCWRTATLSGRLLVAVAPGLVIFGGYSWLHRRQARA